nr:MAG TPA: hypothetical protein [Caudoviricetes sp.]
MLLGSSDMRKIVTITKHMFRLCVEKYHIQQNCIYVNLLAYKIIDNFSYI